jgi:hypothetical protein
LILQLDTPSSDSDEDNATHSQEKQPPQESQSSQEPEMSQELAVYFQGDDSATEDDDKVTEDYSDYFKMTL